MGAKVSVCALVVAAATTSSSGSSSDIGSGSSSGSSSTTAGLFYHESFDDDVLVTGAFTKSMDAKYKGQPLLVKPAVSAIKGLELDKGLSLSQENRHYGASAKFPTVLDVKGKDLVVQYDLKLEDGLQCGGAYIKLLRATPDLDLTKLNGDTPYTIMFGPDKCAANNKVHFIVQYQSPVTQKWEEKHFNTTLNIKTDKANTHLYTLVMKQNNDFEIYIDKRLGKKGNLLTHMVPPINPPSTVDDPTDSKPDDWVDNDLIDDPDAKKPDDWDEDAPKMIENPKAQVRCRVVSASHAWTCSYFLCHIPPPPPTSPPTPHTPPPSPSPPPPPPPSPPPPSPSPRAETEGLERRRTGADSRPKGGETCGVGRRGGRRVGGAAGGQPRVRGVCV